MNAHMINSQAHREEVRRACKNLTMALQELDSTPPKQREGAKHVHDKIDQAARIIRDTILGF